MGQICVYEDPKWMEGLVSATCEPGLIERAAFPARTVLGYVHM